ncbi:MAG: tRNA (guanosine(46)-N7)-methyltransferase TrmB [Peptococcaceae bacterium]|nr:tRNA (guanosine(46)-N7)-methyltransferase TrmB [Peptococcaceae bacterium]
MARVRRVAGTQERLHASPYTINAPHALRGHWQEVFPSPQPLVMEIGSGRGRWLYTAAKLHPEKNFLGVDVVPEIIMDAIDDYAGRMDAPEQVRFLWLNAEHLDEVFAPGEVAEIYLHFSDPWPKNRHAKRRLTHHDFLDIYDYILAPDGKVHFKTDGQAFFDFSIEEFTNAGWQLENVTRDLYANLPADNIATEYERRFHKRGVPICSLCAIPPHKAK